MEPALRVAVARQGLLAPLLRDGAAPVAAWDFARGVQTRGWRVERASAAAWIEGGTLRTAAADAPRLATVAGARALLVEPAATNRAQPGNLTLSGLLTTGPGPVLGGLDFTTVTDDGSGYLQMNANDISDLAAGEAVVLSCVLSAGTATGADLWLGIGATGTGRVRASYDLGAGTASVWGNQDAVAALATLEDLGGGLFRAALSSEVISADGVELARWAAIDGSLHYALPQIERGAAPSTPILPPATARAAETLWLDAPAGDWLAVVTDWAGAEETATVTLAGGDWAPATGATALARVALYAV